MQIFIYALSTLMFSFAIYSRLHFGAIVFVYHRWRGSKIVGFSQNAQWLEPLAIRILDTIETFYPISLIDSDKYGKSFLIDFFDPLSNTAHVWHFPFKLINHNLKKSYQSVSKTIFPEFRRLSYVHLVLSSLRLLTAHTDSEWFTNRK